MEIETIAVVGPTASGKTRRAVALAKELDGEIISADSRQVYKDMTLGTGKDLDEYENVKYHLIDICEAGEKYNLHGFLRDFNLAYDNIKKSGKLPVICGGSGMYVENALNGIRLPEVPINPELRKKFESYSLTQLTEILKQYKNLHNTTDVDTVKRAIRALEIEVYYRQHPEQCVLTRKDMAKPLKAVVIGLEISRDERRERITERLKKRLDEGMVEEVKMLLDRGILPEDLIYYGLEYKFLTLYITGQLSYDEMFHSLEIAIHQFAKRQMTWFRGMEKRGIHINWIPYSISDEDFVEQVRQLITA